MVRKPRFSLWLILFCLHFLLNVTIARATVTVVDYWRMGENDPGATAGGTPSVAVDSVGAFNLTYGGGAADYSASVAASASQHTGSSLAVDLANSAYARGSIVSTNVDNFGLEAWVNPATAANGQIIAYNGNTGTSGWGIMVSGSMYSALYGGQVIFGTSTVVPGVWTHVALVRNNGTATLYVNGVVTATSTTPPGIPTGNFALGAPPTAPTSQFYTGLIDEVRVFTFAPGQFSTNDLLLNQNPSFTWSSATLLEGPAAGADSVTLEAASAGIPWSIPSSFGFVNFVTTNGINQTNYTFKFTFAASTSANGGSFRTVSINVGGKKFTIKQLPANYVPAGTITLATPPFILGVAVDSADNVYFTDTNDSLIEKWDPTSQTVSTVISSGLNQPFGVTVDGAGNLYIANSGDNAINKWNVTNQTLTPVISSGLNFPEGVAVDNFGNLYIADTDNNVAEEWNVANQTLTTLASGLFSPGGVAVDLSGNVYINNTVKDTVKEWNPAGQTLTTLAAAGLHHPQGVALDGGDNIYLANIGSVVIKEFNITSQATINLGSGLLDPSGVALDSAGNIFIADSGNSALKELPRAFVNTTALVEPGQAGNDSLPSVISASALNLTGVFFPTSDQPWLTVDGASKSFTFTANLTRNNRVAHINILGQQITVTQSAAPLLAASSLVEGPSGGTDSVLLSVPGSSYAWTASSDSTWLHPANASGTAGGAFIFTYDANPGATRTGTLTIAGQALTITQAPANYVAAGTTSVKFPGLPTSSAAVAVDSADNLYFANADGIDEWIETSQTGTNLVSSGLNEPKGLAVDIMGNIYIADPGNETLEEWIATSQTLTNLVTSGLNEPEGVAVDNLGDVYIADPGNDAIEEWNVTNQMLTTLAASGLTRPTGVTVDSLGNVYVADAGDNAIEEWSVPNQAMMTLAFSPTLLRGSVAVDNGGNLYYPSTYGYIWEWSAGEAETNLVGIFATGFAPDGIAVDSARNLYLISGGAGKSAGGGSGIAIDELPHAFLSKATQFEGGSAGSDSLPPVVPAMAGLSGVLFPTSDQDWLTITGVTNGIVSYAFTANTSKFNRTANISLLGQQIPVVQSAISYLAASTLVEGPSGGSDSVLLNFPRAGTASTTANWLHFANANGTTSGVFVFTYDANSGPVRIGTLTIAGQNLTITQVASNDVAAGLVAVRFPGIPNSGYDAMTVDGADNLYFANGNGIYEWIAGSQLATNLVPLPLNDPESLAVDTLGNVYISDPGDQMVEEWNTTSQTLTNLIPSGLNEPEGLAADTVGNIYIADPGNEAIEEWNATNQTLATLVSSGLISPTSIAVDSLGNVYIVAAGGGVGNPGNNAVEEWSVTNQEVTTLASTPTRPRGGVAVDNGGNLYFPSTSGYIWDWSASQMGTNLLGTFVVGFTPVSVAVDSARDFYLVSSGLKGGGGSGAGKGGGSVSELPHAFLSDATQFEGSSAGSDSLPPVVTTLTNLPEFLYPTSDQAWLTISGVTNDIVSYGFTANPTTFDRTANITLLGRQIPVVQYGVPSLATGNLLEGPAAGIDSVLLSFPATNTTWTASADATWLHPANTSGNLGGAVAFTYDANPGPARTGTLTIAGFPVVVTQAPTNYVAAGMATLVSSGLKFPTGVAVDAAGNVFIADTDDSALKEWSATNQTLTTVAGLNAPEGVAVDAGENVYIADFADSLIEEWNAVSLPSPTSLVSDGLNSPEGVAVDTQGNVYIADTGNNAIEEWNTDEQLLTTNLALSGLHNPEGVTVDFAGNIYVADTFNNAVKEWNVTSQTVTPLISSGLADPDGIAVDNGGNVYVANTYRSDILEWVAANQTVMPSISSGLDFCQGVAVDNARNIYINDTGNQTLKELPHAFVNNVPAVETGSAGSDSLPPVFPAAANLTGAFYPVSDQPWLTITGVASGGVNYAFSVNTTGTNRVAHVMVLGVSVTVTQQSVIVGTSPVLTGVTTLRNSVSGAGGFQFTFTNNPNASFTVLASTNLTLPLADWSIAGTATNLGGDVFQFSTSGNTNSPQMFYRVRSP